ncbi:MAG: 30S ribosomal protein S2 [Nitrospinota bacterium]
MSSAVGMKQLLEAGSHFGHQTKRWNPRMKPYIFGARNGIYIIDLQKTLRLFRSALKFVSEAAGDGKVVLFVATKKQAQALVQEEAVKCDMPFVTNRWLGGMLTNYETVKKRVDRLNELEKMKDGGLFEILPKKEVVMLEREMKKLSKNLSGIKNMKGLPEVIFIVDPKKESIALREARKLKLKIIAMIDTDCDPEGVDYVIPANDDAIRSIRLIASSISAAVMEGSAIYAKKKIEQEKEVEIEKGRKAKEEAEKAENSAKDKESGKKLVDGAKGN